MDKKVVVVEGIIDDIRRIFHAVNEQSKKAKGETGLTGPQLWAIKTIEELSPVRVSDLAARMHLHPATVVGILNRLELHGLILRKRTNQDRRIVTVTLTDAGNAAVAKARAPRVAKGLLAAGLEILPLKKLQDISYSLEELVHILGAQELPPQLVISLNVDSRKRKAQKRTPDGSAQTAA